jgi:hypothetical protein
MWTVEAREFGGDEDDAAERFAASERARGGRVVVITRRFTSGTATTRRSQWRIAGQVIVESEDYDLARVT